MTMPRAAPRTANANTNTPCHQTLRHRQQTWDLNLSRQRTPLTGRTATASPCPALPPSQAPPSAPQARVCMSAPHCCMLRSCRSMPSKALNCAPLSPALHGRPSPPVQRPENKKPTSAPCPELAQLQLARGVYANRSSRVASANAGRGVGFGPLRRKTHVVTWGASPDTRQPRNGGRPKHGAARLRALPCSAASRSSGCSGHDKEGRARASSGLRLHLQRHPLRLRCCKGPGASGMPESKLGIQLSLVRRCLPLPLRNPC